MDGYEFSLFHKMEYFNINKLYWLQGRWLMQFQNQIETGAFVGSSKHPDIRLDYTIHNVFSMIQFADEEPSWDLLV